MTVYAGHPKIAYASAVKEARSHYLTPRAKDKDIVIANTFAKVSEPEGGLIVAFPSVRQDGGDVVLVCNSPESHIAHYLMGPWGKARGGKLQLQLDLPSNVNHLIIFDEYPNLSIMGYFRQPERVSLMVKWNDVLNLLESYHGENARVAVYPNSEIQYCEY